MRKGRFGGYIVVEATFSFVLFSLLLFSILTLINVVTTQARIHYALTQTANTMSMYSYLFAVTGVSGAQEQIDENAQPINDIKDNIETAIESGESIQKGLQRGNIEDIKMVMDKLKTFSTSTSEAVNQTADLVDSGNTIPAIINYILQQGVDMGKQMMLDKCVKPMMVYYLKNGKQTGKEYLESVGVHDLRFTESSDPLGNDIKGDDKGFVQLSVRYRLRYSFSILPLPFDELKITQTVKTKAWLGGSDQGY